jgi:hypothetical protein
MDWQLFGAHVWRGMMFTAVFRGAEALGRHRPELAWQLRSGRGTNICTAAAQDHDWLVRMPRPLRWAESRHSQKRIGCGIMPQWHGCTDGIMDADLQHHSNSLAETLLVAYAARVPALYVVSSNRLQPGPQLTLGCR